MSSFFFQFAPPHTLNKIGGTSSKYSTCQCRRHRRCRFDPWVGKIPWRRKWQPTPVFLPAEFHGQRSLAGYSPWTQRRVKTWLSTHEHNNIQATGIPWERTLVFLLYINFSTVDIHYLGYTHTFLKGLPSFTLPINNPLNTWGSAAKIPCSSFMKSSELSLPDFTLDMGLMRIHLPRNGSEGNKIRSCQIECKAKMLGFLGECQGWHLLAYSQQESWSSSQLECRRNNPPPPVSLPGFYSQQRQASCPGGCASKGLGGAPL